MKRVLQVLQDGKCLLRSDENRFVAGDGTRFNRYHRIARHKLMENYAVAMSLDGYIAGPNGEYDWICTDSEVDFAAFWTQFDTLLMGRRTVQTRGETAFTAFTGVTSIVFSRTLKQQDHLHVTILPELNADWVRDLKAQSGKDIRLLFGDGSLFRSFFDSGLVDGIEVAVIPVLLGAGIPLLPPPYSPTKLRLISQHLYRSGRLALAHELQP